MRIFNNTTTFAGSIVGDVMRYSVLFEAKGLQLFSMKYLKTGQPGIAEPPLIMETMGKLD
jgi:hypothetical protein